MEKFRSRKWLLTCFIVLTATAALMMGKLAGAEYATIITAAITSYNITNAALAFKSND